MATELLQEERDAVLDALVAQIAKPTKLCSPTAGLTLAASDEPVDAQQIELRQRSQEWFCRDEPHCGGHTPQVIDPPQVRRTFD